MLRLCERKQTRESFCKHNSFPFESQKLSRGSSEPRKPLLIAPGVGLSWNGGEHSEKKRTKRLRPWLSLFRRRRKKNSHPASSPETSFPSRRLRVFTPVGPPHPYHAPARCCGRAKVRESFLFLGYFFSCHCNDQQAVHRARQPCRFLFPRLSRSHALSVSSCGPIAKRCLFEMTRTWL